jgi:hypothetical protein
MRMRWFVLVGGLSLAALALSLLPPCSNPLMAQAGCCKMRSAGNAPWTKRPDLTLAACREQNTQKDKDDLFEASGLVWWDRACR